LSILDFTLKGKRNSLKQFSVHQIHKWDTSKPSVFTPQLFEWFNENDDGNSAPNRWSAIAALE